MSLTLTRTQIYIQPSLLDQAKKVAKKHNKNLSQLIRESLEKNIIEILNLEKSNSNFQKPLKVLNLKNKGVTTIALTHNDIYD